MISSQERIIELLKAAGLQGVRRVWSMGDTVIAFRKYVDAGNGIKAFDGYVCIYPIGDKWGHCVGMVTGEIFETVDVAASRAIEILRMGASEYDALLKVYYAKIRKDSG